MNQGANAISGVAETKLIGVFWSEGITNATCLAGSRLMSELTPRLPLANAAYPHATASARSAVRSAKPISVGSW
jgi:hypothetical protein